MDGKFTMAADAEPQMLDWGKQVWLSSPASTGARQLTIIDVRFGPGKGHAFHYHPDQEEVLCIVAGEIEQWVDREKRLLGPGDSAFVPAGMVHASFNAGSTDAHIIAILGPSVGEGGYEAVEVASETPWNSLRD